MTRNLRHIVYGGITLVFALLWSGCSQEEELEAPSGIQIVLKEFQQEVHTRAVPADLDKPLAEQFDLQITEAGSNKLVHEGKVSSKFIPLRPATYDVAAAFGHKDNLGIDAPAYEGTASVTLKERETQQVNLTCKVSNALLSVKVENPELFQSEYSEYRVMLRTDAGYVKLEDFTQSIYFPTQTEFSLFLEGISKETGLMSLKPLSHNDIPTVCTAAQHIILTLKLSNVSADPSISKVEVLTEEISATIPMEWLPKPKIQNELGFVDNGLSFVETETKEAKLKFVTATPLQDLKLKFNFQDKDLEAHNNQEYLLSNPEHKAVLTSLGLVVPEIGATAASLDLQALTQKLQTLDGATTTNTVEVDVKANNRWSSEDESVNRTYTLTCNKPQFTLTVPEASVWTKEFAFKAYDASNVTAGSPEKLREKMTYQLKENGQQEWQTVALSDLVCGNLKPNTTYQARSLYRNVIPSNEVTVTTYPTIELPNGNMEEWNFTETKEGRWPTYVQILRFFPYNKGSQDAWWATNMDRATIWTAFPYEITTSPNVSYVSDAHGGSKAAEVRTSGHGGGYATTGTITYDDAAFAGRLFIGTYQWKNGEVQTLGNAFASRPTALSFWYKYTPFKTDAFKVLIQLKNAAEEVIAEGTFVPEPYAAADATYQQCTIQLVYHEVADIKPTSIYVDFASTNATRMTKNTNFEKTNYTYVNGATRQCYIGSRLKIDDITLVYDK